ncbi:MAG: E3 binding domain-containing protein, partial [Thermomicrobiales bacterium]
MSATMQEERVWYSPAVRVLSAHLGIDPATVMGTGRNGRVTRNDILAASTPVGGGCETPSPSFPPATHDLIPLSRLPRMT